MPGKITDIVISLLFGMIGGIGIYWYLADIRTEPTAIVTVDIRRLIDTEKNRVLLSDNAEDRLKKFSNSLHEAIDRIGDNRIVIIKDAVISGATDITDEVKKNMQEYRP